MVLLQGKKLPTVLPPLWFCFACGNRVMVTYLKGEVVRLIK